MPRVQLYLSSSVHMICFLKTKFGTSLPKLSLVNNTTLQTTAAPELDLLHVVVVAPRAPCPPQQSCLTIRLHGHPGCIPIYSGFD